MATIVKGKNARKPYTVRYQAPHSHNARCQPGCTRTETQRETSFVTRHEADDFKAKFEHDKRAQIFIDPRLGDITFREYAERWYAQHPGAANSKKNYRVSLDRHIYPAIGDTSLRRITRDQVRTLLLEAMPAKPVGRAVVETARVVINAVLGEAVTSKRITDNPAKGIRLPAAPEAADFYTPARAELEKLATGMPAEWRLGVWLMRGCGLRIGEALAVSKTSVRPGGVLRISEQVLDRPLRLGPLKHRKPGDFRDVPLPRWADEKINAHVEAHGTTDDGHLFASWSMENFRRAFMRQAKAAGLPASFTPHDLRHVWASVALANGVPVTDVSRYLGHRSVDMTFRIYSHHIPSSFETARNVLDGEWNSAGG